MSEENAHSAAWLERYGSDYDTEAQRTAAYRDHQEMLAEMREVFGS